MEEFKRTTFVKNLFQPKGLLNKFLYIEFESVNVFLQSIDKEFFLFSGKDLSIIRINVKTIDELKLLKNLLLNISDVSLLRFSVVLDMSLFSENINPILNVFPRNTRFHVPHTYELDWVSKFNQEQNGWFSRYALNFDTTITYENYAEVLNSFAIITKECGVKFFNISIDYVSFEKATMADTHKIRYFLNQAEGLIRGGNIAINTSDFFARSIFVDDKIKLYINKRAFEEKAMLFDLLKFEDKDGETIKFRPLNDLLAYMDLPIYDLKTTAKMNLGLIDVYQNLIVNESYSRIPFISRIFMEALV